MIKLRGICKSFGPQVIFDQLDLDVHRGEVLGIIGKSGVGKSVLLKHIVGLMPPDAGQVLFDGVDFAGLSEDEFYRHSRRFGMLFQGAALFDSLTVGENVGFALRRSGEHSDAEIDSIVAEKLRMVGLEGRQDRMPAELSGGMKKRVGLARAIAMDPDVVLYDEPTTGLDPIMSDVINNLILKLNRELQVTSIAVTHDLTSAFKIAGRLVMLYRGKIIEGGTPDETRNTTDPVLSQFIEGRADGPITTAVDAG